MKDEHNILGLSNWKDGVAMKWAEEGWSTCAAQSGVRPTKFEAFIEYLQGHVKWPLDAEI